MSAIIEIKDVNTWQMHISGIIGNFGEIKALLNL